MSRCLAVYQSTHLSIDLSSDRPKGRLSSQAQALDVNSLILSDSYRLSIVAQAVLPFLRVKVAVFNN